MNVIKYRSDIDGLRTFAVLSVIIFHLNSSFLYGGFIGVDVFFVISGYLITRIIVKENKYENFSFLNFYSRRVKRILPVLFFVLLATICIVIIVYPIEQYEFFIKSLRYASAQISNFYFAQSLDYFAPASEQQPLLHTWSLAVEEQFYLIWPLLIVLTFKFFGKSKSAILFIFLFAALFSLFTSYVLAYDYPKLSFYMVYSRAWELCIGGIIALDVIPNITRKKINNIFSVFGFMMIILSFIFIKNNSDFLKGAALIPCLGTAIVLYTGQQQQTWIGRFLSFKPFVFIGLISYSLYLWHWPVIVFYKQIFSLEELEYAKDILIILLAVFILSVFSYYIIEKPFRKVRIKNYLAIILAVSVAFFFAIPLSSWLDKQSSATWRVGEDRKRQHIPGLKCQYAVKNKDYNAEKVHTILTKEKCSFDGEKSKKALLIGDSHSHNYFYPIKSWAEENNIILTQISSPGCPAMIYEVNNKSNQDRNKGCMAYSRAVKSLLDQDQDYQYVFWAIRGDMYTTNKQIFNVQLEDSEKTEHKSNISVMEDKLKQMAKYMKENGKDFFILSQVPLLNYDPLKCYSGLIIDKMISNINDQCPSIDMGYHDEKTLPMRNIYQNVAQQYGANVFFPEEYITQTWIGKKILYGDKNHLEPNGAEYLSPHVSDFIDNKINKKD